MLGLLFFSGQRSRIVFLHVTVHYTETLLRNVSFLRSKTNCEDLRSNRRSLVDFEVYKTENLHSSLQRKRQYF